MNIQSSETNVINKEVKENKLAMVACPRTCSYDVIKINTSLAIGKCMYKLHVSLYAKTEWHMAERASSALVHSSCRTLMRRDKEGRGNKIMPVH